MKINWKVRFKNPQFLIQLFASIVVPIGGYFGISGVDITTWGVLWDVVVEAVSNPYLLFIVGVSVFNAVLDPTTTGISDSKEALTYEEPKEGDK